MRDDMWQAVKLEHEEVNRLAQGLHARWLKACRENKQRKPEERKPDTLILPAYRLLRKRMVMRGVPMVWGHGAWQQWWRDAPDDAPGPDGQLVACATFLGKGSPPETIYICLPRRYPDGRYRCPTERLVYLLEEYHHAKQYFYYRNNWEKTLDYAGAHLRASRGYDRDGAIYPNMLLGGPLQSMKAATVRPAGQQNLKIYRAHSSRSHLAASRSTS